MFVTCSNIGLVNHRLDFVDHGLGSELGSLDFGVGSLGSEVVGSFDFGVDNLDFGVDSFAAASDSVGNY